MTSFKVGDKVVKNPNTWQPNEYDQWGRGEGIGEIAEPHKEIPLYQLYVKWPGGACYENAMQLVHLEERDLYITEIPCIRCDLLIKQIYPDLKSQPTSAMWHGGVVFKDGAGYGSLLDGDIYLVAVCDECLKLRGLKIGEYI